MKNGTMSSFRCSKPTCEATFLTKKGRVLHELVCFGPKRCSNDTEYDDEENNAMNEMYEHGTIHGEQSNNMESVLKTIRERKKKAFEKGKLRRREENKEDRFRKESCKEDADMKSWNDYVELIDIICAIINKVGKELMLKLLHICKKDISIFETIIGMENIDNINEMENIDNINEMYHEQLDSINDGAILNRQDVEIDSRKVVMYKADITEVLKKQISLVKEEHIIRKPDKQKMYTHPVHSKLGLEGMTAVEQLIKGHEKEEVRWRDEILDGEESFVGCVQFYTDKSMTTLKSSGLTFYPVHVTLLNFTEEARNFMITNGYTVVGYLPTIFYCRKEESNEHM
ncbi:MAG: hypothetical protein AAF901_06985 [Bacteroidota bacterium]